jgi:multidrug efflux pump
VINDFTNAGRQQRVVVQAEQGERMTPESVLRLYAPNANGEQVPFSAFVTTAGKRPGATGALQRLPSIRIAGDAAPGHSTGQAMAEMERLVSELPPGSATPGRACPTRRRSPAARPPACSPWPSWWCSCCWWRCTKAGRSR